MKHLFSYLAPVLIACGLLCSCTSIVRCPVEESSARQLDYNKHKPLITAAVTHDADTVTFDSAGGLFDRHSKTLVGFTREGRPVGFTTSEMRSVFVVSNNGYLLKLNPLEITQKYRHLPREKIMGLKLKSSKSPARFGKYGGWISPEREIVISSLNREIPAKIYHFADIEYVEARRYSPAKTIGLAAGIAAGGMLIVGTMIYIFIKKPIE